MEARPVENSGNAPGLPESAPTEKSDPPPPLLGENAQEAQRMTYAGRRTEVLKQARIFDESRLEKFPLFENAQRQGRLI